MANRSLALVALLGLGGVACSGAPGEPGPGTGATTGVATVDPGVEPDGFHTVAGVTVTDACRRKPGEARCHAKMVRPNRYRPSNITSPPSGFGATDLWTAYHMTGLTAGGVTPTVGIVDAYNAPNAEADLAVYRAQYGLPACTTANGCFRKVDQYGVTIPPGTVTSPATDSGWAGETSLDVDMASAGCPWCNILLVEANTSGIHDLGAGVNMAVKLGASVVSNSYGSDETSSNNAYDAAYYTHVGVSIFASAGDHDYQDGTQFPAVSTYVIGVGGTALVLGGAGTPAGRGWTESVWNTNATTGTGSGCSAYTAIPPWQGTAAGEPSGCAGKVVSDLSAVAADTTYVALYDTTTGVGWTGAGGTSVASPLVAAIFAAAGLAGVSPGYVWDHKTNFYDVTTGNNGTGCPGTSTFVCTAAAGFDGPTGWGTPNGALLAIKGPVRPRSGSYAGSQIQVLDRWALVPE